jgi:hypothetical protein
MWGALCDHTRKTVERNELSDDGALEPRSHGRAPLRCLVDREAPVIRISDPMIIEFNPALGDVGPHTGHTTAPRGGPFKAMQPRPCHAVQPLELSDACTLSHTLASSHARCAVARRGNLQCVIEKDFDDVMTSRMSHQ